MFFVFLYFAQQGSAQSLGINTSGAIPDSSAMLDIISTSKGLLIPRLSLSSTTDSSTIAHPAISLMVYNTNASMTGGAKGYWYWTGTQWTANVNGTAANVTGVVLPANGGTGIANNNSSTLTLSGAYADTLIATAATKITLPTSGTLYSTKSGSVSSSQLATSLSDETGSGAAVFATSPSFTTPALGTPVSGVLTNCTGTATGLTAGNVTTNANLTGVITSVGNTTSINSQTGTGSKIVVDNTPTLIAPLLGTPTSGTLTNCTGYTEANLVVTDITTNNASTSAHGFAPKYPNDATKYLDGTGAYTTPAAGNLTGAVTSIGLATSLGSFSSANLSGALTDETGTGAAVFATEPTFTTSLTTPLIIGGSANNPLTYKVTTGSGGTGADHIFQVGSNGTTEAMRILNSGKVGIGVTSPQYILSLPNQSPVGFYSDATHLGTIEMYSSTGAMNFLTKHGSAGGFNFTHNSTSLVDITNTGNTSIGTIRSHRLSVTDDGVIANNAYVLGVHTDDGGPYAFGFFNDTYSTTVAGISGYSTNAGAAFIGTEGTTGLTFFTHNINRISITSAGNVGIGTTSPTDKLTVENASNTNPQLVLSSQAGNGVSNNELIGGINYYSNDPDLQASTASINVYAEGTHTSSQLPSRLTFSTTALSATTPSERMRIDNAGNVGIGTTTPASVLDVEGGISIGASFSGTTAAPSNGAIIEGNVGIGTSSPNALLNLKFNDATTYSTSSSNNLGLRIDNVSNTDNSLACLLFAVRNGAGSIGNAQISAISKNGGASADLSFQVRNSGTTLEAFRIANNGQVGIGTTTPGSTLEIAGTIGAPYVLYTSAQTLGATQYNVNLTNAGASYAITLPNPVAGNTNRIYRVKQMTGTACTVTTVGGTANFLSKTNTTSTSVTLTVGSANYTEFQSDGSQWVVSGQ